MSEKDQVVEILRKAISPPFKATMGDGAGNVVVTGRPGYVWCRKLGRTEMLMQAYNRGAQAIEGIIILVQDSRVEHLGYEVVGYAGGAAPDDVYPPVPPHAWTHEWRPGIGRDRVTVYPRSWGYLRAEPIETGSMNVWVTPGWLYHDEEYIWYPGSYSPAFGPPAGSTWYQTLYMDPSDQSLHIIDGITGGYGYAGVPVPSGCMLPIAAIESTGTFSAVTENMIEDIRLFMDPIEDCGGLLPFGSCYGNHIAWVQTNAVQNTWYNISDTDIADGSLEGVIHDGSGKLTVTEPGEYLILYSLCYEDDIAKDHLEAGIEVNGSGAAELPGRTHSENKFANEMEHLGGGTILNVPDNATVELAIRTTDAGTPTITIIGMNLSLHHLDEGGGGGGTRAHNLLDGSVHPDTAAQAVTRGSLIVGEATLRWDELSIGAAARYLRSDGTDPAYASIPASEVVNTPAGGIAAITVQAAINELDTEKFRVDCTIPFAGDPIPDGADTRSLGSVDAEWENLYMGEAGKIYFRLDQSVNLYSSAAGVLKTDDHFHCALEVFAGNGLVGGPAYAFISDVDTGMYRIGVNDLGFTTNSTLALELNAVQQALVTNGTVAAPGLAFISDPDTGLYRLGANRLGFATAGAFAVEIDATGRVGIGATPLTLFHIYENNATNTTQLYIQQAGAGDAVIQYTVVGRNWAQGIDNSDADKFKLAVTGDVGTNTIMAWDTGGNVTVGGHKTQDLAQNAAAWDDAYADDWHNVADLYLLDRLDDLAVICGIQPSGEIDPRTGLPLIDDKSLPEWAFTKDKKGKKVLYDPDGRPYLSMKMLSSLSFGAIRQLKEWVERLEAQIV